MPENEWGERRGSTEVDVRGPAHTCGDLQVRREQLDTYCCTVIPRLTNLISAHGEGQIASLYEAPITR